MRTPSGVAWYGCQRQPQRASVYTRKPVSTTALPTDCARAVRAVRAWQVYPRMRAIVE